MVRSWVEHFPAANPDLLQKAERFFIEKLTIHQQLEAVILFASALEEQCPKDVDFFIVSDDQYLKDQADHWMPMIQGEYWYREFTPDFFFRVSTNLDLNSLDGKRDFDDEIYLSILNGRRCVVFCRKTDVKKYLESFPQSFVVQART